MVERKRLSSGILNALEWLNSSETYQVWSNWTFATVVAANSSTDLI
jgi:hypothetical protein